MLSCAHARMPRDISWSDEPRGVSAYVTVTGTLGVTVRVSRPSRSSDLSVWVSIFWLTPTSVRDSSE